MKATPRLVKRATIYRGNIIQLVREVLEVKEKKIVRETVIHPGAVVVVPMLDNKHVIFVRQYRCAVKRELIELPAGTLGIGERHLRCAKRELEEETGWHARHMRRIGQFYAAPGFTSEELTVFLAWDLMPVKQRLEIDEFITPVIMNFQTAISKINTGIIRDAKSIIGVLFAFRFLRNSKREIKLNNRFSLH